MRSEPHFIRFYFFNLVHSPYVFTYSLNECIRATGETFTYSIFFVIRLCFIYNSLQIKRPLQCEQFLPNDLSISVHDCQFSFTKTDFGSMFIIYLTFRKIVSAHIRRFFSWYRGVKHTLTSFKDLWIRSLPFCTSLSSDIYLTYSKFPNIWILNRQTCAMFAGFPVSVETP